MPIYSLKLIDRFEVAKGTLQLIFEKPAGFTFKPGQYGGFTLIHPSETDARGITRRFSLLSTPDEETLSIAMRLSPEPSAYKRTLATLPLGNEVKFAGPTGNFILPEETTSPVVFLAGGIGVTPFYSMLRYALAQGKKRPFYLFYGNQQLSEAAFYEDFQALAQRYAHFHFIPTLDKPTADWKGDTGFIRAEILCNHIKELSKPIYYICGSPFMVTALQEMLAEMLIDENRIKVEDFPGY